MSACSKCDFDNGYDMGPGFVCCGCRMWLGQKAETQTETETKSSDEKRDVEGKPWPLGTILRLRSNANDIHCGQKIEIVGYHDEQGPNAWVVFRQLNCSSSLTGEKYLRAYKLSSHVSDLSEMQNINGWSVKLIQENYEEDV